MFDLGATWVISTSLPLSLVSIARLDSELATYDGLYFTHETFNDLSRVHSDDFHDA
jgi:hypothetical protein